MKHSASRKGANCVGNFLSFTNEVDYYAERAFSTAIFLKVNGVAVFGQSVFGGFGNKISYNAYDFINVLYGLGVVNSCRANWSVAGAFYTLELQSLFFCLMEKRVPPFCCKWPILRKLE